jgi:hypothetical protein
MDNNGDENERVRRMGREAKQSSRSAENVKGRMVPIKGVELVVTSLF